LPDDLILYLRSTIREPDPLSEDDRESDRTATFGTKKRLESILWDQHPTTLPGGNYPALCGMTFGLLRRKVADFGQWLTILEGHLVNAERSDVWLALLHYLRFLAGADRQRSIKFVEALLSRYPEIIPTPVGVRFIASCQAWFPQNLFDETTKLIGSSGWKLAQQALGELLVLRAAIVPEDKEAEARR
jgi:hypothetical protein